MQNFRTIKGTYDLLPDELIIWREVENFIHSIMQQNGYGEIRTPAFENTELFVRGIGTDTDIVTKEMYSWMDQGGNTLTLKPELTAPVARAYLQHQLGNQNPIHRLYYFDALFRRERPQKGRQRQFHQFGAEAIGSPNPEQDAEIIALAYNIYKKFNIQDMTVRLNSIGNAEIRPTYLETLRSSVKKIETELCSTCQTRIEKNALRLFDCKNPHCQELLDEYAPFIFDSISDDDQNHFEMVTRILKEMEIPYFHDKKLVRGLDYYSHTTFEISSSVLGAQDALCGGGRYNGLIEKIGGNETPGVGFGMGVERVINEIINNKIKLHQKENDSILFIYLTNSSKPKAIEFNIIARKNNIKSELAISSRSLKSNMRYANNLKFSAIVIIGDPEEKLNYITYKELNTGDQKDINEKELIDLITNSKFN